MAQNGDYLVWKVHFNNAHTHIDSVKAGILQNGNITNMDTVYSRQVCVDAINAGKVFYTVFKKANETNWTIGKQIFVIKVNGKSYLKTEPNNKEEDNLDNLPEF